MGLYVRKENMAWCLPKHLVDKFKRALKSKEIDPAKLAKMTSEQRRQFLEKYVGKDQSQRVNSLFESKLLLKNQKAGMITWAKRTAGLNPQAKRDIISRIERMDTILSPKEGDQFLQDLASTRLGVDVTKAEAEQISKLSNERVKAKESWQAEVDKNPEWADDPLSTRKEWIGDSKRLNYGLKQVELENYVNDLKIEAKRVSLRERPVAATVKAIKDIPGVMKSLMSSLDDSFYGRQGIVALLGQPYQKAIWARDFAKSFDDIAKSLRGQDVMDLIKADVYSRPNALNGKYKAGGYGLDVLSEEAFPSSFPERIPGLGRLFKASEVAFNGGALRMRADLADVLISKADKQGINTLDPNQARGMGHLIGSMTGRGSIGKLEPVAKEINVFIYSIKLLKSSMDVLTAHQFDPKATPFTKKEARKNLASVIATVAGVLSIAKMLNPDSVDEDPRSTNSGKVKVFGKWINITGHLGGLVRTAARLVPTKHNGEWGLWQKSSTGKWTDLTAGKFGQQDGWEVLVDSFFTNKLAPIASIWRDALRGEMFGGEPFNITKSITNSLTPLSIQTFGDLKDESYSTILGVMAFELFGFSPSTYKYKASWEKSTSKEMKQFKETVGEDKFKQANEDYNRVYNIWFDEVTKTDEYKKLSDDGKSSLVTKSRAAIKDKIFKEYGFKYKAPKKTLEEKEEEKKVKELLKVDAKTDSQRKSLLSFLVKPAYAAEGGSIPSKDRPRAIRIADELRKNHPEWYTKTIGEAGEMSMFGYTLGWPLVREIDYAFEGLEQTKPNEQTSNIVVKAAKKNEIDTSTISAMLWQESGYTADARFENLDDNGNVVSIDRGMAQINSKAYPKITEKQADDPDFAIRFMARTLKSDLKYFDGDFSKAIVAYNRGRRRVKEDGIDADGQEYLNGVAKNLTEDMRKALKLKTTY